MEKLSAEEIGDLARKIALDTLAPRASEIDQKRSFPWENIAQLRKSGLWGTGIYEEGEHFEFNRACFAALVKEIAKACASTALIYVSHTIVAKAIEHAGSSAIKKKWPPEMLREKFLGAFAVHEPDCGSNAGAITTRAKKEGDAYIVNGSKFFITSAGEADIYLVLVRTDPEKGPQGMSTLLIEKDSPGLSFGRPEEKMGLTGTSSREMYFSDCRVPVENLVGKEGEGAQIIGKAVIGWGFFGAAAISVGIAGFATELAIKHVKERIIAGQPLAVHQAIQFMITDMILETEASDALLNACATQADLFPDSAVLHGFKAKLFASENAVNVANKAIQVLGGHGYCREYIVERLFRDARGLMLHFKTSEWLRQDIAKAVMGM
ncbi:MAG: acyl-CoA dehydrogenase family protein [Deltaproteobacteria bacterium]|nr:acyl-CoA dehydrogenase family protein [Deltaproteobacteria bacterium]